MTKLTDSQYNQLLDELEELVSKNDSIISAELDYGSDEKDPDIILNVDPAKSAPEIDVWSLTSDGETINIPVSTKPSNPIDPELGGEHEIKRAFAANLSPRFAGMGGTMIVRPDGRWGTLSFSTKGIDIKIVRGGTTLQRCTRDAPTLVSNAHVLAPNNTLMSFDNQHIGTTLCHFDLNRSESADYGHGSWDDQFKEANYFRVFDQNNKSGKPLVNPIKIGINYGVGKQGARTGWSTGYVQRKVILRLSGYRGTFRCWKAAYASAGGDSGSPVIYRIGSNWYLAGIHFAAGGHFWSWDDIGRFTEDGSADSVNFQL